MPYSVDDVLKDGCFLEREEIDRLLDRLRTKKNLNLPDREATWVHRLFEKAVGGFYDVVLQPQGWRVRCGGTLNWQVDQKTSGIDRILPAMRTDVVLDHALSGRRIVVDTKFTSIVTDGWYREETLRSGYVYQIYAYLRSQVGRGDPLSDCASGLLLHPSVGDAVDETVTIQGHRIRFATVDLKASTGGIRLQLLGLCELSVFDSIPAVQQRLGVRARHSTVTDFARFLGLSTSVPRAQAVW